MSEARRMWARRALMADPDCDLWEELAYDNDESGLSDNEAAVLLSVYSLRGVGPIQRAALRTAMAWAMEEA